MRGSSPPATINTMASWFTVPLSGQIWRRSAYALAAFPAGLASMARGPVAAARVQSELAARLLPRPGRTIPHPARPLLHWLVSLVPNALTFSLMVLLASNTVRNLAYPLWNPRPEDWGGPSLAGRWLMHGVGWLPVLYLGLLLLVALTAWQGRMVRQLLTP